MAEFVRFLPCRFSRALMLAVTIVSGNSQLLFAQSGPQPTQNTPILRSGGAQVEETLSARTQVRLEAFSRAQAEAVGRIETLEGALAQQSEEIKRLTGQLDSLRASMPRIADENNSAPGAGQGEGAAAAVGPIVDSGTVSTQPEEAKTPFVPPSPPPLTPEVLLTNAQTALQGGNYQGAEANLTQLIWLYPTSPQASEGRWLLGEARYVQAAWGSAAQAYVDYLKVSPQGPRASEALLRLAGVFRQLGDTNQRCLALAEFKRRTPKPDPTLKARADAEIARMSCTTP